MCNKRMCAGCHGSMRTNRRSFLIGAGTAAGALATADFHLLDDLLCFAAELSPSPEAAAAEAVVDVVFVWDKADRPTGNMDWTFGTETAQHQQKLFTELLEKAGSKVGVRVRARREPVFRPEEISRCLEDLKKAPGAGLIVCCHQLYKWKAVEAIVEGRGDIATVVFSHLANQTELGPPIRYKTPKTFVCTAARLEWLEMALRLASAPWRLRHARLLLAPSPAREMPHPLGPTFLGMPDYHAAYQKTEIAEEMRALADFYEKTARKVVEPAKKAIFNAVKHYVVLRGILREKKCQGVSVTGSLCVGAGGDPGPACVAISRLGDEGLVGCCEGAVDFAVADLVALLICGCPAVMGNAAHQTATDSVVISHCYSPTKLRGPEDPYRAAFQLRDFHGRPACVPQVFWPVGKRVTLLTPTAKKFWIGRGQVLSNVEQPPAFLCRTAVEFDVDGLDWNTKTFRTADVKHSMSILGDVSKQFDAFGQLTGLAIGPIVEPRVADHWHARHRDDAAAKRPSPVC